jgi:glycosyltransferase involved in cell wall biosynthesis
MILIDSIYINSFGGKTILQLIINKLIKTDLSNLYFLFDKRLDQNVYSKIPVENFIVFEARHKKRKDFYLENYLKYSKIVCLANIPPPMRIEKEVIIYFHNDLLLFPFKTSLPIFDKLINLIKNKYIHFYNNHNHNWVVQTSQVKEKIIRCFKTKNSNVFVFPIYTLHRPKSFLKKESATFAYIASNEKHKNIEMLLDGFIDASKKVKIQLELNLTIQSSELIKPNSIENLKIICHGSLNIEGVYKLYEKSKFLIFPSLNESFGLPLIEAADYGCKVIASDLPYVHEIIKPSLTFDPYSVESISAAILKAVSNDNLPETKVIIENKLDNFIEYILK